MKAKKVSMSFNLYERPVFWLFFDLPRNSIEKAPNIVRGSFFILNLFLRTLTFFLPPAFPGFVPVGRAVVVVVVSRSSRP
jgi:hypothetical protein